MENIIANLSPAEWNFDFEPVFMLLLEEEEDSDIVLVIVVVVVEDVLEDNEQSRSLELVWMLSEAGGMI